MGDTTCDQSRLGQRSVLSGVHVYGQWTIDDQTTHREVNGVLIE